MSLLKIITADSLYYSEPVVQLVKVASGKLRGADLRVFEKRASSDLLSQMDKILEKLASDEQLIHLLAVGATEDYGANRNGDGFRRAVCRACHNTFEKYAFFFRNHKNKDPRKSYGRVIKSAFHDPMKRIELLVTLNATQSAADRNHGLVADREMEKLATGKEIPVSMACRVSHDICSYCGNKAPTVGDYCTGIDQGGLCKAGGLRDHIGSLIEIDGGMHQLHADNPDPSFFDISHVFRPADRIAYVTGRLTKAAAASGRVVKSAELAAQLGITAPPALVLDMPRFTGATHQLIKTAYRLAEIESRIEEEQLSTTATAFCSELADSSLSPPVSRREKFAGLLRAMVDRRVCLSPAQFIEIVTDHNREKAAEVGELVARQQPGIYQHMLAEGTLEDHAAACPYMPGPSAGRGDHNEWVIKMANDAGLRDEDVEYRLKRAAIRQISPTRRGVLSYDERAVPGEPIAKLSTHYALYKLAFVGSLPNNDPYSQLTAIRAIMQNYIA